MTAQGYMKKDATELNVMEYESMNRRWESWFARESIENLDFTFGARNIL